MDKTAVSLVAAGAALRAEEEQNRAPQLVLWELARTACTGLRKARVFLRAPELLVAVVANQAFGAA